MDFVHAPFPRGGKGPPILIKRRRGVLRFASAIVLSKLGVTQRVEPGRVPLLFFQPHFEALALTWRIGVEEGLTFAGSVMAVDARVFSLRLQRSIESETAPKVASRVRTAVVLPTLRSDGFLRAR